MCKKRVELEFNSEKKGQVTGGERGKTGRMICIGEAVSKDYKEFLRVYFSRV